ncbi:hypothetical protein BDZ85DRAFT_318488 [Elsinoe ampelina]|uniref:Uncharacterized protein n=1 Tax=Elsinoe ampelina TaxID=302913 RepID=A0A6A6GG28_9PEZI|nr:hypothetical protein BDZ85DRAFT_318488 [Elsinoe ampelina]
MAERAAGRPVTRILNAALWQEFKENFHKGDLPDLTELDKAVEQLKNPSPEIFDRTKVAELKKLPWATAECRHLAVSYMAGGFQQLILAMYESDHNIHMEAQLPIVIHDTSYDDYFAKMVIVRSHIDDDFFECLLKGKPSEYLLNRANEHRLPTSLGKGIHNVDSRPEVYMYILSDSQGKGASVGEWEAVLGHMTSEANGTDFADRERRRVKQWILDMQKSIDSFKKTCIQQHPDQDATQAKLPWDVTTIGCTLVPHDDRDYHDATANKHALPVLVDSGFARVRAGLGYKLRYRSICLVTDPDMLVWYEHFFSHLGGAYYFYGGLSEEWAGRSMDLIDTGKHAKGFERNLDWFEDQEWPLDVVRRLLADKQNQTRLRRPWVPYLDTLWTMKLMIKKAKEIHSLDLTADEDIEKALSLTDNDFADIKVSAVGKHRYPEENTETLKQLIDMMIDMGWCSESMQDAIHTCRVNKDAVFECPQPTGEDLERGVPRINFTDRGSNGESGSSVQSNAADGDVHGDVGEGESSKGEILEGIPYRPADSS